MASGEAEPLQYTTTALRVSIHCEGCKKKVKKVLHAIEGVYKVTVDAAQHKVTVTGNVQADALVRRLHKAGKQAALWPSPPPAQPVEDKKKPEAAAPAALPLAAGESCAKDGKPNEAEATKDKTPEKGEGKEKQPAKEKKAEKGEAAAKPNKEDAETIAEPKETKKGSSPESAKQHAAEDAGAEEPSGGGGGKKGKKNKKNKPKDGAAEGDDDAPSPTPAAAPAAAPEKKPHQPTAPAPSPPPPGPERAHGGAFPYYAAAAAAQPVLSYNVAHPGSSVSYYAPTPAVPVAMPPPPQVVPYGYPHYPAMVPVPVPAEYLYGPPGLRSSPPQESYNNLFNEDNANSCSIM